MRDLLAAEGIAADVAPLLEISVWEPDRALLSGAAALVVTSRNGLRGLEKSDILPDLLGRPLLVVGRGTGAAAKALGFGDVTVGPATAKDLVPLIIAAFREKIAPAARGGACGPVVHLCGDKISFDLQPPLAAAGIALERATVYRSQPVTRLPQHVAERLGAGGYDAVVLMSPLTAQTYVDLVGKKGLAEGARRAAYLCLSRGIAAGLSAIGAEKVKVAAKPNIEEMLALIRETAAQSEAMSPPEEKSDTKD